MFYNTNKTNQEEVNTKFWITYIKVNACETQEKDKVSCNART